MNKWKVAGGAVAAIMTVFGVAACSAAVPGPMKHLLPGASEVTPTPATFQVSGTVSVEDQDDDSAIAGTPCVSPLGYDDIEAGGQITILDASGTKLAYGYLQAGDVTYVDLVPYCEFPFTINGVPEGQKLYDVQVGNSNRGTVTEGREDLGHDLDLVLGG